MRRISLLWGLALILSSLDILVQSDPPLWASGLIRGAGIPRAETEDTTIYKVVVNHEEQYSIWPADRENPLGWNDAGKTGTKEECLSYIAEMGKEKKPTSKVLLQLISRFRASDKTGAQSRLKDLLTATSERLR